jgi:hypothetical protein
MQEKAKCYFSGALWAKGTKEYFWFINLFPHEKLRYLLGSEAQEFTADEFRQQLRSRRLPTPPVIRIGVKNATTGLKKMFRLDFGLDSKLDGLTDSVDVREIPFSFDITAHLKNIGII